MSPLPVILIPPLAWWKCYRCKLKFQAWECVPCLDWRAPCLKCGKSDKTAMVPDETGFAQAALN